VTEFNPEYIGPNYEFNQQFDADYDDEACCHCGVAITRAEDGAWDDDHGACGCGDGEHEPGGPPNVL